MLTLTQLQDDLCAALQAQSIAARAAEDAEDEAAGKSGRGKEIWLEERDAQEARAQDAGLMARELSYQIEAYQHGQRDAAAGRPCDVDPRDCRPQDRDALAYCAGFAASRQAAA